MLMSIHAVSAGTIAGVTAGSRYYASACKPKIVWVVAEFPFRWQPKSDWNYCQQKREKIAPLRDHFGKIQARASANSASLVLHLQFFELTLDPPEI